MPGSVGIAVTKQALADEQATPRTLGVGVLPQEWALAPDGRKLPVSAWAGSLWSPRHHQGLSRRKYRSNGIPDGLDVLAYGPAKHPNQVAAFRDGYLWDQLTTEAPNFAAKVAAQDCCLVLTGEIIDPSTLNYFRDVIGFLTFCSDAGGVAIYDANVRVAGASEWRSNVFDIGSSAPRHHVVILVSSDSDGTEWIRTRGMRKFGRPDISVHKVGPQHKDAIIDLCNRFIELLAFGGIVQDGQEVRLNSLPPGMKCWRKMSS